MNIVRPLIALLSDFGLGASYVASMKGAIYNIIKTATIVDISHEIPAQNIVHGAFTLRLCYRDFPKGTIFVCVVDPDVGSARQPILVTTDDYYFLGPDNGILSGIFEDNRNREVHILDKTEYFRFNVSSTFHGRDIFAPCAAWLAKGVKPRDIGSRTIHSPVTIGNLQPRILADGTMVGQVILVDRFGNLVTNVSSSHVGKILDSVSNRNIRVTILDEEIPIVSHYEAGKDHDMVSLWGSGGFLEIASYSCSAFEKLGAGVGLEVTLKCQSIA